MDMNRAMWITGKAVRNTEQKGRRFIGSVDDMNACGNWSEEAAFLWRLPITLTVEPDDLTDRLPHIAMVPPRR
jgi:hypothetical protein